MLKSVKGKVLTGVVTVGLLTGVGTAFANVDAGAKLGSWYNTQFGHSTQAITSAAVGHIASKTGALQNEYNGIKNGANIRY